jgi:WD40 repeat protein
MAFHYLKNKLRTYLMLKNMFILLLAVGPHLVLGSQSPGEALDSAAAAAEGDLTEDEKQIFKPAQAQPHRTLAGHQSHVLRAEFSQDGKFVLTAAYGETARVWEVETGECVFVLNNEQPLDSAAFSDDATSIMTTSIHGGAAKIWDAKTGVLRHTLKTPDGENVSTGKDNFFLHRGLAVAQPLDFKLGKPMTVLIWDAQTGQFLHEFGGQLPETSSAAMSPDGARIITLQSLILEGSYCRCAVIWDVASGKRLHILKTLDRNVEQAAFSPDGRRVVTVGGLFRARYTTVWDADSGALLERFTGPSQMLHYVGFTPRGTYLFDGCNWGGQLRVWDVTKKGLGHLDHEEKKGFSFNPSFSSDETLMVTASLFGDVKVWDLTTRKEVVPRPVPQLKKMIRLAKISPDGNFVLTSYDLEAPKLWKIHR